MRGDTIAPTPGFSSPRRLALSLGTFSNWPVRPWRPTRLKFARAPRTVRARTWAVCGQAYPASCSARDTEAQRIMAAVHTPCRRVFDEYSTGLQLPCWRPLWMPSSREPSPTVARVVWSHHRLHHLGAAERRRRRSRIRRRASSRSRVESSVRHPAPLGSGSGVLEPFGTGGMESEYRAVTVPVRSVVLPWLAVPPVAALALDRFRLLRPVAVLRRE